MKRELW